MQPDAFDEAVSVPPAGTIASSLRSFGERARDYGTSWFTELVAAYMKWRGGHGPHVPVSHKLSEEECAQAIIRRACVRTALTGAAAGSIVTGTLVLTQETGGSSALLAIPAGVLALGTEMVARALLLLDMTCDLGEAFGVPFDPTDPKALWRLYALVFQAIEENIGAKHPDCELLQRIVDPEESEIGSEIGGTLMKESVLRNIVPFVGIATSAATNWRVTSTVGDTVRRYCRYHRALRDTFARHPRLRSEHIELVIEGIWFVFQSDGHLTHEEIAALATVLQTCPPARRRALDKRLIPTRSAWLQRLATIPPRDREAMFELLEVAAALDKSYAETEQELLAEAAEALGVPADPGHVLSIVEQFKQAGVLVPETPPGGRAQAHTTQKTAIRRSRNGATTHTSGP